MYYAIHNIHEIRMPATMLKGKSSLVYRDDTILKMDWMVGEITKQLEKLGLEKNTMIIFSSDNEPVLGHSYANNAEALSEDYKPA